MCKKEIFPQYRNGGEATFDIFVVKNAERSILPIFPLLPNLDKNLSCTSHPPSCQNLDVPLKSMLMLELIVSD